MPKKIASVPKGYKTVTPELVVRGADAAIAFYQDVFDATVLSCMKAEDEITVLQAEIKIGTSILRLSDEMPAFGIYSPLGYGGTAVGIHIYHDTTDEIWDRALTNGAGILVSLADTAWGERYGKFIDPFGHVWSISRRIAKSKPVPVNRDTDIGNAVAPAFSVHEPHADHTALSGEKEMSLQATEFGKSNVA